MWIKPLSQTGISVPEANGFVRADGRRYAVQRVSVIISDYEEASEIPGTVQQKKSQGPYAIGPLSTGKVHSELDGVIDADWYFKLL
jgi:hypothetical protein